MDATAIDKQLVAEERQLVARAAQNKRDPAEMAYALAKQRGYQPKATAAPADDAAEKLARIEHGQRQSKSMSGTGGNGATGAEITLEDLVRMSDKDFETFKTKYPARYRRLKGSDR
jgi:hypothetical protein